MTPSLASSIVVPPLDEFGLPAPAWLFQFLIVLTMLLHVVFMNFTLGGAIVATVLDVLTLLKRGNHNLTVRVVWQVLPVTLSLTITTGVAPLLFVQVLFGQVFYPANVLMGFTWFAIVPILILAFYLAYFLSYRLGNVLSQRLGRWNRSPAKRLPVSLIAAALFLMVGWILTNNHMLEIQPEVWAQQGQWVQNRLAVTPAQTAPRYLHNVTGALALAGLWLAATGHWRRRRRVDPPEIALALTRTGLWVAVPFVIAATASGLAYFFVLPAAAQRGLMALNPYTVLWGLALLGVAGQLAVGFMAAVRPQEFRWFAWFAASALLTLVGMLAGREQIRLSMLAREEIGFSPSDWPVYTQTSALALFLILLVITLGVVAWLAWVGATPRPASPELEPKT